MSWWLRLYRSSVGKKAVMAITGAALFGFVLAHMVGNLKLYLGKDSGRNRVVSELALEAPLSVTG